MKKWRVTLEINVEATSFYNEENIRTFFKTVVEDYNGTEWKTECIVAAVKPQSDAS